MHDLSALARDAKRMMSSVTVLDVYRVLCNIPSGNSNLGTSVTYLNIRPRGHSYSDRHAMEATYLSSQE
jgi:hypothetical protein